MIENYSAYTQDDNGFYYGIKDKLFKSIIFSDKSLTLWFLSKLMGRCINDFTIRNVESIVHSAYEKEKRMDIVLEIDDNLFIDIEANSVYSSKLHMKNFNYLSSLYSQLIVSGKKYDSKKELVQFDITRKLPKKYKHDVEEIHYQNIDGCKYLRSIVTYIQNVDRILKYWYNEDEIGIKKYAHILMLVLNEEGLNKLVNYVFLEDIKYIERFKVKLVNMNKDFKFRRWISEEDEKMFMIRGEIDDAFEEGEHKGFTRGVAQGIEQGIEQTNTDTIKNMMEQNLSIDLISKCVNLPIDKVKKIVNSIENVTI